VKETIGRVKYGIQSLEIVVVVISLYVVDLWQPIRMHVVVSSMYRSVLLKGTQFLTYEPFANGVVVGKRLPPLQSHAFEWVRGWVRAVASLHHAIDKVEKPSLDGIWHHDTDRDLTNHVPIIISSLSFFSVLFLSSSQSTISLRLLPPYAPRNEASIFVASYGNYRVRSPDPRFPPQMVLRLGGRFGKQSTGK